MVGEGCSVWAYPWDILDEGAEAALDRISSLGGSTLRLACSYHSGKILSPRNPSRRVYFPEGGVIYFPPSRYLNRTAIEPAVSQLVDRGDPLGTIAKACERQGMNLVAWLVGTHNTRLATKYPQFAVRNAYGDAYSYALCPSHRETTEYLRGMVADLAESGAISAVEIESFGFLGFYHGYHHEMAGVPLGLVEQSLLSLCFCTECERLGRARGIDVDRLRLQARVQIDAKINSPSRLDDARPDSIAEVEDILETMDGLREFVACRCQVVTDLVRQVAEEVHARGVEVYCDAPVFMRAPGMEWVEGINTGALSELVDFYEVDLHVGSPEQNAEEASRVARLIRKCRLGATINVGFPTSRSQDDVLTTVRIAKQAGFNRVGFYNYGMLPDYRLAWIGAAVKEWQRE